MLSPAAHRRICPRHAARSALRDRKGRLLGYLCALLQPVVTDLLAPLSQTDGVGQIELDLIDRRGVVVASTDRRGLFRTGDHDQLLAGLSVRSVVRPVTALTRAVREVEDGREKLALPAFGGDEVGQLARALNLWRERLVDSLAAAEESRLLREAGLERERQRQQYLHRVLKAREDERRLVARELHDTVAQDLAALRLEIERLGDRADDAHDQERLGELEARVQQMLATVRAILLDMRLSVLESMGCVPALEWQLERLEEKHGIRATFVCDGSNGVCDYETAVTPREKQVLKLVAEGFSNKEIAAALKIAIKTVMTRAIRPSAAAPTRSAPGATAMPSAWRATT